jgi:hypothetical protein
VYAPQQGSTCTRLFFLLPKIFAAKFEFNIPFLPIWRHEMRTARRRQRPSSGRTRACNRSCAFLRAGSAVWPRASQRSLLPLVGGRRRCRLAGATSSLLRRAAVFLSPSLLVFHTILRLLLQGRAACANVWHRFASAASSMNGGESSFAGWPDAKWPDLGGMASSSKGFKAGGARLEATHVGEDVPTTPAQVRESGRSAKHEDEKSGVCTRCTRLLQVWR